MVDKQWKFASRIPASMLSQRLLEGEEGIVNVEVSVYRFVSSMAV